MRFLGFLIVLAGLAMAYGERLMDTQLGEFEIGRYYAVSPARQFAPILITMREDYAPLAVSLEVTAREGSFEAGRESVLTMNVTDPDGQVTEQTLTISSKTAARREDGTLFLENVFTVNPVKDGVYTFHLGDGDRDELGVSEIVLNLKGHAGSFSFDFRRVGFILLAVGGVMFLLGGGRRRRKARGEPVSGASKTSSIGYRRPESKPEKRKPGITWGREGDDD